MPRASRRRKPDGPFEIEIGDLSREGEGIGRQPDGKAAFVADALPGERVRYLRTQRGRDFDRGSLIEVLRPSEQRAAPPCAHFGSCGGCSLQHLDPRAQVEFKERSLLDSLARIGNVKPDSVLPPLVGPDLHYRRRARLNARNDAGTDEFRLGFHSRNGRSLVSLDLCSVLEPVFSERLAVVRDLIRALSIRAQVLQVELAAGDNVTAMVLCARQRPSEADRERLAAFSRETGIWIWLQGDGSESPSPLLPDTPELSYWLPQQAVEIRFGPLDFVQSNAEVNRRMVTQAMALLDLRASDVVLELFAGVGNFTLPLARATAQVVAVEGEAGLVERARSNALLNRADNVIHYVSDLSAAEPAGAWLDARYDAVLLDPPRNGASEILPHVAAQRPGRILYVSCHPGTLARDAALLVHRHGYRLRAAGIMDMFPHTSHVESMALFEI